MRAKSGGGITSNKLRQSYDPKVEPKARAQNVDAVAQQGRTIDFQRKPLEAGKGYEPQPCGPTGVPGKFNAAKAGPGSGRTIYPSGGQSQYGPANPGHVSHAPDPSATGSRGRDTLAEYGPEIKRR